MEPFVLNRQGHLVETSVVFLHAGGFGEGKLSGYLLRHLSEQVYDLRSGIVYCMLRCVFD